MTHFQPRIIQSYIFNLLSLQTVSLPDQGPKLEYLWKTQVNYQRIKKLVTYVKLKYKQGINNKLNLFAAFLIWLFVRFGLDFLMTFIAFIPNRTKCAQAGTILKTKRCRKIEISLHQIQNISELTKSKALRLQKSSLPGYLNFYFRDPQTRTTPGSAEKIFKKYILNEDLFYICLGLTNSDGSCIKYE